MAGRAPSPARRRRRVGGPGVSYYAATLGPNVPGPGVSYYTATLGPNVPGSKSLATLLPITSSFCMEGVVSLLSRLPSLHDVKYCDISAAVEPPPAPRPRARALGSARLSPTASATVAETLSPVSRALRRAVALARSRVTPPGRAGPASKRGDTDTAGQRLRPFWQQGSNVSSLYCRTRRKITNRLSISMSSPDPAWDAVNPGWRLASSLLSWS